MTDQDIKRYETLLRTHVEVRWTNEDVKALLDEVRRLRAASAEQRPSALRDVWAGLPRFVGGH